VAGVDGSKEISGSGVVYLFAKSVNKSIERYAHLAVIGSVGDVQEDNGFLPLNNQILEDAVANDVLEVDKGLRFFGLQSKPLHRVLAYCKELPGVSNESTAVQFLLENNISPKSENVWRKFGDLSSSEKQRLIAAIILRRSELPDPESVVGNVYSLPKEDINELKDVKEFSTVLNACGRMDRVSFGIGSCLGDMRSKRKAISTLTEYRGEIVKALNWFRENKQSKHIISKPGFVIINAKGFVLDTVIGTLASILSKGDEFPPGTFVMSLARKINSKTKISLRYCGENEDINLKDIIEEVVNLVGGEVGGHAAAAGAVIPSDVEDDFVNKAAEVFGKLSLEERVL
jgi:RecJ-like exonuclease